jgi:hypothetical protein
MLNTLVRSEPGSRRRIERSWRLVSRRGADFRTIELCRRAGARGGTRKNRNQNFSPERIIFYWIV